MKPTQKLSLFRAQRAQFTSGTSAPSTFGQARAEALQRRHEQKVVERRNLRRAEYATQNQQDQTLHTALKQRGEMKGREIDRLQQEMELQQQDSDMMAHDATDEQQ